MGTEVKGRAQAAAGSIGKEQAWTARGPRGRNRARIQAGHRGPPWVV